MGPELGEDGGWDRGGFGRGRYCAFWKDLLPEVRQEAMVVGRAGFPGGCSGWSESDCWGLGWFVEVLLGGVLHPFEIGMRAVECA